MTRADLVVGLAKSGLNNDSVNFKKYIETIIIEEREKQHTILANTLEEILQVANQRPPKTELLSTSAVGVDNLLSEIKPKRRFDELILEQNVRETCEEFLEEQRRVSLLRAHNLEPRNRLLFTGPPGNGKTSLAAALAKSLMLPIYSVRYDGLIGSYLGETAARLGKIIDFVRTKRCILFLDEFETLGKERGDTQETGEIKRVVSSLLLQIDSLPSHVIVIGATNHPELLDRAVWRRFQIRLELNPPTHEQIIEWLKEYQSRSVIQLPVDIEDIASKLDGASYSDIEEFGTTLLRRYVLSLPEADLKSIVNETLKYWDTRTISVI